MNLRTGVRMQLASIASKLGRTVHARTNASQTTTPTSFTRACGGI